MKDQEKLQELQFLEQNLNSILMQKQALEMESAELQASLVEINKTKEDVFKLIGNLLIKADPNSVKKELDEKIKHVGVRLKAYESQEKNISKRIEEIRNEMIGNVKAA